MQSFQGHKSRRRAHPTLSQKIPILRRQLNYQARLYPAEPLWGRRSCGCIVVWGIVRLRTHYGLCVCVCVRVCVCVCDMVWHGVSRTRVEHVRVTYMSVLWLP